MSTDPRFQPISVRDYLQGEAVAKRKHEYVDVPGSAPDRSEEEPA